MKPARTLTQGLKTLTQHAPFRPALVLPTFNNVGTLPDVLDRALELGLMTYVVNDGSTDATNAVLSRRPPHRSLKVLSHLANKGKAAAMRTGFLEARGDGCTHVATIDTDGQLDPEEAASLIEAARRAPTSLVLGTRAQHIHRYPASNRLGRRLANWFIWLECGVRVSDSQCGLRVYPLAMFEHNHVRAGRYGFETEVITRAGWAHTPVIEVPVTCRYFDATERVTHFRPWVDTFRAIGLHAFLLGRRLTPMSHPRWPVPVDEPRPNEAQDSASTLAAMPLETDAAPVAVRVAK